jgi:hypothetical protein
MQSVFRTTVVGMLVTASRELPKIIRPEEGSGIEMRLRSCPATGGLQLVEAGARQIALFAACIIRLLEYRSRMPLRIGGSLKTLKMLVEGK